MKFPTSETFRHDLLRHLRAANTRLLGIGIAFLFFCFQANAGQAPTVTIGPASQVTGIGAIIGGTVNANGLATWARFRWGTTATYDHFGFPFQWPATARATAETPSFSACSKRTRGYTVRFVWESGLAAYENSERRSFTFARRTTVADPELD